MRKSRSPVIQANKKSSGDSEMSVGMDPPMEREAISRVSLKKVKTNLKNKGMIKSERVRQE